MQILTGPSESEHSPSLSLYFQLAVHFCVCPQDLLCYLVDDGGFLIMSNQKDDWNKVFIKKEFVLPLIVASRLALH